MQPDGEPESLRDASLRPFRDHVFHFAPFDEVQFHDDHYHCIACGRVIAGLQHVGSEREGYVTLHQIHYTGMPVLFQYVWVCSECFPRYQEPYGWRISTESVPEIPTGSDHAFDLAYREYLRTLGYHK